MHPVANGTLDKAQIRSTENGNGCNAGDVLAVAGTSPERRGLGFLRALTSSRPIRGCTAVIVAGERMLAQLAAAYNNRGVAFRSKGELNRAIEDYD
jgi:hypothetical protein